MPKSLSANFKKSLPQKTNVSNSLATSLMTTKDVSQVLNVSDRWVRNTIKKLRNNNSAVFKDTEYNSQGGFLLNEAQVTAIKLELQNHSKVNHLTPKTYLEKQLLIKQAMRIQDELIEELQHKNDLLTQERDILQIELDESKEWYSIKRMQKLNPDVEFKYSTLKKESVRLGYEIKKVFDANYGNVNAYHKAVYESLFFDTLDFGE